MITQNYNEIKKGLSLRRNEMTAAISSSALFIMRLPRHIKTWLTPRVLLHILFKNIQGAPQEYFFIFFSRIFRARNDMLA